MPLELYTSEEAADYLGVTPPTIRQWVRRGQLHSIRVTPTLSLYMKGELDVLKEQREMTVRPGPKPKAEREEAARRGYKPKAQQLEEEA